MDRPEYETVSSRELDRQDRLFEECRRTRNALRRENRQIRKALEKCAEFISTWRDCLEGVQMSAKTFAEDSGLDEARNILEGIDPLSPSR